MSRVGLNNVRNGYPDGWMFPPSREISAEVPSQVPASVTMLGQWYWVPFLACVLSPATVRTGAGIRHRDGPPAGGIGGYDRRVIVTSTTVVF